MKSLVLILFVSFSFVQVSCGQHNHNENSTTKKDVVKNADLGKVNSDIQTQLNNLLLGYFEIKNALVATNGKLANSKAGEFIKLLAKVEIAKMTTEQQIFYKPLAEKLKFDAEHINETEEASHQRDHFESFSTNLFVVIKNFKANKVTVYQQFCPMAFDNKGAFWLSDKAEIRNPYFGDKMLKCGKVTEKL
jgi:hypothetical protein